MLHEDVARRHRLPRVLSLPDVLGVSLSSVAPTFTIGVALGVLASTVALSMPAVWVLAVLPMIGIAVGLARLNARDPRCGTAYTWAGTYWHPWAGFLAGWIVLCGFVVFLAYATQVAGQTTLRTLEAMGAAGAGRAADKPVVAAAGLGWLVVVLALAVGGVALAVRLQKVLIATDIVAVLGICGWALLRGGGEPVSWSWFNPFAIGSAAALTNGLVATVYLYWGWDNSLRFNEETRDAGRSAGRAAVLSLLTVAAVFVFCQVAFQHVTGHKELTDNGAGGLVHVAGKLAGRPGEVVAALLLLLSIVALMQSTVLGVTRQLLAMSRDRVLGPMWARLDERRGTPVAGTVILGVAVAILSGAALWLGDLNQLVGGVLGALGLLATVYYAICGVAVAAAFRTVRKDAATLVATTVLPLLSAAVLIALSGYAAVHNWTAGGPLAFNAANTRFQDVLAFTVIALGVPVGIIASRFRRSPYFHRSAVHGGHRRPLVAGRAK